MVPGGGEDDHNPRETIIELWIGKNKVVPLIVGGRTVLPMRFVAENLGCTVEWNAGAITVVGP